MGLPDFGQNCYQLHSVLAYGLEAIFLIECKIPSLKLAVQLLPKTSALEVRLVDLEQLDETRKDAAIANEAHKHVSSCNMTNLSALGSSLKGT